MTAPASKQSEQSEPKRKLGRGLGALLGDVQREEPLVVGAIARSATGGDRSGDSQSPSQAASGLAHIPVGAITPLPGQPRTNFNEEALDALASSIAARGVIQPIIVRRKGEGRYELVAGERRWRAAQRARLHHIPAIVRELDTREVMALALIENLQREDLNPIEEARAYQQLADNEGLTQAEIARMVDKSRSHVANLQRLLALPAEVLDLVEQMRLSMGHARALVGHEDAIGLARRAVADSLSVREIERLASKRAASSDKPARVTRAAAPGENADIAAVQGHLEEFLGLAVRIKTEGSANSGSVTIRYRTLDQLDLICQRLTGGDI